MTPISGATGQTGIFISGRGVSLDAVVADFISGAAEWISPAAEPDHWDVIEGQGSLFHPSFAGVTLGLLHGSQPDAFVVCHEPTRTKMRGVETPLPTIRQVIDMTIACGQLTNPEIRCVGICVNTAALSEERREEMPRRYRGGIRPAGDGPGALWLREHRAAAGKRVRHAMTVALEVRTDSWPIAGGFTIARGSRTHAHVVTVTLREGPHTGRGECVPYARYGESVEGVMADIEKMGPEIERGLTREALQQAMPAGAARNALDCAFWDLEAKRSGVPAFRAAGVDTPHDMLTAFTISLGTPDKMAADTAKAKDRPLLKVKLGGDGDRAHRGGAASRAGRAADRRCERSLERGHFRGEHGRLCRGGCGADRAAASLRQRQHPRDARAADPGLCRRKPAHQRGSGTPRPALRCGQHQARQDRRVSRKRSSCWRRRGRWTSRSWSAACSAHRLRWRRRRFRHSRPTMSIWTHRCCSNATASPDWCSPAA
jgi:hypothetical protein